MRSTTTGTHVLILGTCDLPQRVPTYLYFEHAVYHNGYPRTYTLNMRSTTTGTYVLTPGTYDLPQRDLRSNTMGPTIWCNATPVLTQKCPKSSGSFSGAK
ncbi:MAG: hypothetical protein ABL895_11125 [Cyclobacteriaceae bacterium]